MPPTKHSNRSRRAAAGRGAESLDGDVKLAPKPPASIDILSYPHLLAHILDLSPPSTLSGLLKCSKAMFQIVCPRLYRNLRLEQAEVKAMIDAGWARSNCGFSTTLRQCLSHTTTLHITDFLPTFDYPKIPRGSFSSIATVVLYEHPGWLARNITLPPLFQSLGTHLYIRLSEAGVKPPNDPTCIVVLDYIPKSFRSVTLLVPKACWLDAPPSCGFFPPSGHTRPADGREVTVVLLPWEHTGEEVDLQRSMAAVWETTDLEEYALVGNVTRFVGAEVSGQYNVQTCLFAGHGPDPRLTSILFHQWLVEVGESTVFGEGEWLELAVLGTKLIFEPMRDRVDLAERTLEVSPITFGMFQSRGLKQQATYDGDIPAIQQTEIRGLRNDMARFKTLVKNLYATAGCLALVEDWL